MNERGGKKLKIKLCVHVFLLPLSIDRWRSSLLSLLRHQPPRLICGLRSLPEVVVEVQGMHKAFRGRKFEPENLASYLLVAAVTFFFFIGLLLFLLHLSSIVFCLIFCSILLRLLLTASLTWSIFVWWKKTMSTTDRQTRIDWLDFYWNLLSCQENRMLAVDRTLAEMRNSGKKVFSYIKSRIVRFSRKKIRKYMP